MIHIQATLSLLAILTLSVGCIRPNPTPSSTAALETAEPNPSDPIQTVSNEEEVDAGDAEVTKVRFTTTEGEFIVEVHPEWAPRGAKHWLKLIKLGYYNDVRFFRVVPGFMAQVGISGDPNMSEKWADASIPDDKVVASNKRGYISFAQTGRPNSRSTQWFINFGDNSFLDTSGQGFPPIGKVIEGMSVVDSINSEFGERPDQGRIESEGNEYLDEAFDGLTKIIKAEIIDDAAPEEPADAGDKPRSTERPEG